MKKDDEFVIVINQHEVNVKRIEDVEGVVSVEKLPDPPPYKPYRETWGL